MRPRPHLFFSPLSYGYNIVKYSIIEISFYEKKYEYLGMIVYIVYNKCEMSDMNIKGSFGKYIVARA